MTPLASTFSNLRAKKLKAFIPFISLGQFSEENLCRFQVRIAKADEWDESLELLGPQV